MLAVKIGRMMSHWMIEMMVLLDGQNEKLDSASFGESQFWTENTEDILVD